MNVGSFQYFNSIYFFNDKNSEKIGFYFSFCLHLIFLLFVVGFPNLFKPSPVSIPLIVPIEIVNVTDVTSITKENDENNDQRIEEKKIKINKFNSVQQNLTKAIEITPEPKINEKKNNIVIKEKIILMAHY